MQVSSWNSHDIHWYTITHDIFIDIPMIKDVSCIYPFLGNHPLRSLKLMAAQRPISTVAVLSLEFPVCSAANVLRSCDTVNLLWKPRKQESLRWPLPKQDRKNPNLVKSAMLQTCFQSIELRNKLGWLPIGLDGRWYMKIACYGRFPLTKRFYDIFLLTFVGASSWQGWKSVQLDLDMMKARFHKVSTREITRGRWKDPNGSAANFNNFFLIAKRIVLNFPRIVFRVPHDFWSKFRCSGIWRTRWSLHWRSRSWWGGRSWQGGWQGPGRCKGGEDRSNLMIFFTDSWVFSEIRLRQLPWSTYPGIKMY